MHSLQNIQLVVGSDGIKLHNQHGIWPSDLQLTTRQTIKMLAD
jgi:hypothetical protein